jgi:hypothetical protein
VRGTRGGKKYCCTAVPLYRCTDTHRALLLLKCCARGHTSAVPQLLLHCQEGSQRFLQKPEAAWGASLPSLIPLPAVSTPPACTYPPACLHLLLLCCRRRVAWERGQLTPERLAGMDHPITGRPVHLPHLYDPFQHYLWILKTTHSGGWVGGRCA